MEYQLFCKICQHQFDENTMPRLLPKCFHSYCQSCIKKMLDQCKDYQIKIICPQDSIPMELDDKDINNFPKNISLIKQFRKKSVNLQREQSFLTQSQNQDSIRYLVKTMYETTNPHSNLQSSITQKEFLSDDFKIPEIDICLIHSKPLDIICVIDATLICSNCALFGNHRNHNFKSISEVQKDKADKYQSIINLMDKKQNLESKFTGKESKLQYTNLVNNKRNNMVNQIHQKYLRLHQILKDSQLKCLETLNKNYEIIEQKIKQETKIIDKPSNQYKIWLQKAFKQIQSFDTVDNLRQQLYYLNYSNQENLDIIKQGQLIINDLQKMMKILNSTKKQIIQSQYLEYNNQIQEKFYDFFKIQIKYIQNCIAPIIRQNLNISAHKQNLSQITNRRESTIQNSSLKQIQSTQSNPKKFKSSKQISKFQFQRVQKRSNLTDILKLQRSPEAKKRSLMKSPMMSPKIKQDSILSQFKKRLKTRIPEKYDKLIQSIVADNIEVLDLTNAQLGDQIIIQILQLIKGKRVKVVRLVRNKLTDDSINQIWGCFGNVISLNLSQNHYSDKIIDHILLNSKKTPAIKNIILTQNKIKQRYVRSKLQQIKKLDIIVSL